MSEGRICDGYYNLSYSLLILRNPEDRDLLLLKVSPILLINQDEIQVIPCAELLVDIPERRCQFESSQEQPDRNGLASNWRAVHDLEFGNGFGFVVLVGCCSGRFSTDDGELHVFDLDSDQKEVNFAHDYVFEVVSEVTKAKDGGMVSDRRNNRGEGRENLGYILGFVVLEFDMETIFDTDFHLDRIVGVWWHAIRVDPDISLFYHVC